MFKGLMRKICSWWEIPNNPPSGNVNVAVGMSLSPKVNGDLGEPAKQVVRVASSFVREKKCNRLLLSNRFPIERNGPTLAHAMRLFAVTECDVPYEKITVPRHFINTWIRNTQREAEFAIMHVDGLDAVGRKSIFVVANSIHLRRVVATYQKSLEGGNIELFWFGVECDNCFGRGFVQKRFAHPLFFLCYEILALTYSKLKGIA